MTIAGEAGEPEVALTVNGVGYFKEDTSNDVTISASTADATDELTSLVVEGLSDWSVDGGDLTALEALTDVDTATFAGGTLTITFNSGVTSFNYNALTLTPPEDTDADSALTVTANVQDQSDNSATNSSVVNPTLVVDAILDDSIDVSAVNVNGNEMVGEQTFSLGLNGSAINPFAGSGSGGQDTDGSESGSVTLTLDASLVAGASLGLNGGYGGSVILTDNGDDTYTLSGWTDTADLADAIDALEVTVPGGFDGSITGSIDWSFEDDETFEGGVENVEADNNDSGSTNFSVSIADSLPSNPVNDSITVEEESIPGIGGNDEADGLSYEVMGTFANNADWGVDGFGGITNISFDGNDYSEAGGNITVNDVDGNWTLVVNAVTGAYTFTMLDNIDSTPFGDQVEGTDNLPTFTINAQDGDGSPISFNLDVGIVDDIPVNFTPMDSIIANATSATGGAALDVFGNAGADGVGLASFTNGVDGDQLFEVDGLTPVTSGGETLHMFGFGTDTLEIYTLDEFDDPDVLVMTIMLNPNAKVESDDLYTVTIHQPLDDGSGFVFDDFSDTAAGNNQWVGVDADGGDIMADLNDSQDLLITAPGDEVNTDSDDIGVANQWIDPSEAVRLDFVTDLRRDGLGDEKDFQGYTYDDHYAVNNFSLKVVEVQGSGSATVGFRIYDFDDVIHEKDLAAGSTQLAILLASIVVTAADGVTILTEGVDYQAYQDGMTIFVTGIDQGETISFMGASDFEAVEAFNASGMPIPGEEGTFDGSPFSVGAFGFDSAVAGEDVPMEFDVALTDTDGDTASGTISVTATPNDGTITGTGDGEALMGSSANDILVGMGGDDILTGGAGNDELSGGSGADTFVFSLIANDGNDTITDFNGAEDVLKFTDVLDSEPDGDIDLDDLNAQITSVVDNGAGNDVVVTFNNGATITFSGVGTGTISSIESLVSNPATQIDVS